MQKYLTNRQKSRKYVNAKEIAESERTNLSARLHNGTPILQPVKPDREGNGHFAGCVTLRDEIVTRKRVYGVRRTSGNPGLWLGIPLEPNCVYVDFGCEDSESTSYVYARGNGQGDERTEDDYAAAVALMSAEYDKILARVGRVAILAGEGNCRKPVLPEDAAPSVAEMLAR